MITDSGKTTPAPWVPFTRAGCDVGGVGTANLELENNTIDARRRHRNVFGARSPQASEPATRSRHDRFRWDRHPLRPERRRAGAPATPMPRRPAPGRAGRLHAASRRSSGRSTSTRRSLAATLRDRHERTADPGFRAQLRLPRLRRHAREELLGYVAQLQENGVPVTYAYISDAHDNHTLARPRARARPTTSSNWPTTTRPSPRSSNGCRPTGSTRATRSSSSPLTRATTSPAERARRTGAAT